MDKVVEYIVILNQMLISTAAENEFQGQGEKPGHVIHMPERQLAGMFRLTGRPHFQQRITS
jgi:hypothetical protein